MLNSKNFILRQCFFLMLCLGIVTAHPWGNVSDAQTKESTVETKAEEAKTEAADAADAAAKAAEKEMVDTTEAAKVAPKNPITPAVAPKAVVPPNLRLKQLEQRVQGLKERAWRAKARVGMLKEAVLGGGVGARASIIHENKMGNSFRLIKLVYALDGTQLFSRTDKNGKLYKEKTFEIMNGSISPGSHTVSVLAVYQGHGYGVLSYLKKYKYTVRSSHTFTANEGKGTALRAKAFEKGGITTKLKDRPALDFEVSYPGTKEQSK